MKLNLIDINSKKDKEELHKLIDKTHKKSALDINTLKNDTNTALSNFNNKLK